MVAKRNWQQTLHDRRHSHSHENAKRTKELLRLSLTATSQRSVRCAWNVVGQTRTQAVRPAKESRVWRMGSTVRCVGGQDEWLKAGVGKVRLGTKVLSASRVDNAGLARAVLLQGRMVMGYCSAEVWEGGRGGRRSNGRALQHERAHKSSRLASHRSFARMEKGLSRPFCCRT